MSLTAVILLLQVTLAGCFVVLAWESTEQKWRLAFLALAAWNIASAAGTAWGFGWSSTRLDEVLGTEPPMCRPLEPSVVAGQGLEVSPRIWVDDSIWIDEQCCPCPDAADDSRICRARVAPVDYFPSSTD